MHCMCVCVCVSGTRTLLVQHKEPIPKSNGLQLQRAISVTGLGSAELIRPLGHALRLQFLLLLLLDSLHIRAKEEKVRLKVFLVPLVDRPPLVSC